MMNSGQTHFKRTSLDNFLNKLVIYIGCFLCLLALISTVGHIVWESVHGINFQIYLPWDRDVYNGEECKVEGTKDKRCEEGVPEVISGNIFDMNQELFTPKKAPCLLPKFQYR
jgi:hypothetical protein